MKTIKYQKSCMELLSKNLGNRFLESEIIYQMYQGRFYGNQNNSKTLVQRFFDKVAYVSTDCWYWIGYRDGGGYGCMMNNRKMCRAHRISWIIHNGEIPSGLKVLHKCDVRSCVNPHHLFLGTQQENIKDMCKKGRQKSQPLCGEDSHFSKLTWNKVDEIRSLPKTMTLCEIGKKYKVSKMTICRILNNKSWGKKNENK